MSEAATVRIGSRASPLARWQSEWIAGRLHECGVDVEIVWITTEGDVTTGPIGASSTPGLFTKEIQRALLDRRIDLAVHSLKDLPTEPIAGLRLASVPPRQRCGDALISPVADAVESLPAGARIGTGSARRRAQLLHWRPDLKMLDLRGNVDTRLRKLDEGQYDAIVLAEAGLVRLGLEHRITSVLPASRVLPAVGQGALGLETRADDERTIRCLEPLNDPATFTCVAAERSLLATLRGGCVAPVGAWARIEDGLLRIEGVVLDRDGRKRLLAERKGTLTLESATALGAEVAQELLAHGAAELIASIRESTT